MTSVTAAVALGGHLLFVALLVGFMAVVQWSLVPAQNRLSGPAYATLEQGMNRVLERPTPALMIGALVFGGASVWVLWGAGPRAWLVVVSTLGICAMVLSTLIINAPVNAEIDTWDAACPPSTWHASRDRWEHGHSLRAYVGLVALCCAIAAAVLPG